MLEKLVGQNKSLVVAVHFTPTRSLLPIIHIPIFFWEMAINTYCLDP